MARVAIAVLVLACSWGAAGVAAPPAAAPKEVMAHHIAVVKQDDVDGVMQDYAADAVFVTPTETIIGAADIRKFFEHLATEHRDWKAYNVTQEVKTEGVVLQKEVKSGKVEVFVVRHGKIVFQTLPG
jgi:hypothetical protein